jgi:hypothetical protein
MDVKDPHLTPYVSHSIRSLDEIDTVMIHRIEPEVGEDADAIMDWFMSIEHSSMPYTFVVRRDGTLEQAVDLWRVTPHGLMWNRRAVSVAVIGDFRTLSELGDEPAHNTTGCNPSDAQVQAVISVCLHLQNALQKPLLVIGHTMAPNATRDRKKVCPGSLFPIETVRKAVLQCKEL